MAEVVAVEPVAETRPPRLFATVFSHVSLKRCIPIALFVGTVLSLINQGSVIFGGNATDITWLRVGMNYVVPFCVSSSGFFASQRAVWRQKTRG